MPRCLLCLLCLCFVSAVTLASTIRIPDDYPSIASAMSAAVSGDTIVVGDGVWSIGGDSLSFDGRALTIRSAHGPCCCTLKMDSPIFGYGFALNHGEGRSSIVQGFTFTALQGTTPFYFFTLSGSNPTIKDCIFQDLTPFSGPSEFAVIRSGNSSPLIEDCEFTNIDESFGADTSIAICRFQGGNPELRHCRFSRIKTTGVPCFPSAGGALEILSCTATLDGCLFQSDEASYGGGIYAANSTLAMTNCLFTDCAADPWMDCVDGTIGTQGAAIYADTSSIRMVNCTVADNRQIMGSPGAIYGLNSTFSLENCILRNNAGGDGLPLSTVVNHTDIQGGWPGPGSNNIDVDPLFRAPGDYRLQPASPVQDIANQAVPEMTATDIEDDPRIYGPAPDLGAYELNPIADGGGDFTITAQHDGDPNTNTAHVVINGVGTDPKSLPMEFLWEDNGSIIQPYSSNPILDTQLSVGCHPLVFRVRDSIAGADSDEVCVHVTPEENATPVAVLARAADLYAESNGASLYAECGVDTPLCFTGTLSTDPDHVDIPLLKYSWTCTPGGLSSSSATFTPSLTDGAYKILLTITDPYGASSSSLLNLFVQDTLPPVLTLNAAADMTVCCGSAFIDAGATALDKCEGDLTSHIHVAGSVDTSHPGTYILTYSVSDSSGNAAAPVIRTVHVVYEWSGFLQPINMDGTSIFKKGSTIPVKFQLTGDCAQVTTGVFKLYYAKVSGSVIGTDLEAVSTSAADTGNQFRYTGGQYIFNMATSGLSTGTWQIRADLGDGVSRTVLISIK